MAENSGKTGREEIASILEVAVQQDGPIRVFSPKSPALRASRPGLFQNSKGRNGELQSELIGPFLKEISTHPRMVKLTSKGIERLLQNTHQAKRAKLVEIASPLYRDELLATWKQIATRGEQADIESCVTKLYGQWFDSGSGSGNGGSLDDFRELFAQEIASSWNDSKADESKNRLAHLLKVLGAQPLGKKDEPVQFTGLKHIPLEPLFKGDDAKIVTPGWTFPKEPTPLLLVKAAVRPA